MTMKFGYDFDPNGVDEALPLIDLWEVAGSSGRVTYRYVGKSDKGARRPRTAYRLNVNHILDGKPYRGAGKPNGFRAVHQQLAEATRNGSSIRLRLLSNVGPNEDIFECERYWQATLRVEPDDMGLEADSLEQRVAEAAILRHVLGGNRRRPAPISRNGMNFDGLSDDPPVLVEIWAHQGPPKSCPEEQGDDGRIQAGLGGQGPLSIGQAARKILAIGSEEAASPFQHRTWMAEARHRGRPGASRAVDFNSCGPDRGGPTAAGTRQPLGRVLGGNRQMGGAMTPGQDSAGHDYVEFEMARRMKRFGLR